MSIHDSYIPLEVDSFNFINSFFFIRLNEPCWCVFILFLMSVAIPLCIDNRGISVSPRFSIPLLWTTTSFSMLGDMGKRAKKSIRKIYIPVWLDPNTLSLLMFVLPIH